MLTKFCSSVSRVAWCMALLLLVVSVAAWGQEMDDMKTVPPSQMKTPPLPKNGLNGYLTGSWTTPTSLGGIVGIHSVLLHTGKVLSWWYPLGSATATPYAIYDPVAKTVTTGSFPFKGDFFCAGQNVMADGRVLITGGLFDNPMPHNPDNGIWATAIYDPVANTWTQGPNMNYARWYPTNIEEADGKVMVLTGKDQNAVMVLQTEVYDPVANTFTTLPASANLPAGTDSYVKMKVMPTGQMFLAGANAQSESFNPLTNVWTNVAKLNFGPRYHGATVLLPGTPTSALHQVLDVGGTQTFSGGGATATAEIIDLSAKTPQWSYINPINIPRYNANLVILADGNVLYVGGAQSSKYDLPVTIPELYNVAAGTWTEMSDQGAYRPYHSTALLLPDGTVYSAGSDDPGVTTDQTYQIFTPPYLFNAQGGPAARPNIKTAPTSLTYDQQFTITTPQSSTIKSVALVRPGATTHDNDMDQRYVPLAFTVGSGALTVTSPLNANFAPPGYYMLVVVNTNGVPSVMPFTQLCPSTGCI